MILALYYSFYFSSLRLSSIRLPITLTLAMSLLFSLISFSIYCSSSNILSLSISSFFLLSSTVRCSSLFLLLTYSSCCFTCSRLSQSIALSLLISALKISIVFLLSLLTDFWVADTCDSSSSIAAFFWEIRLFIRYNYCDNIASFAS
jgi:hypothetical protein